jgi:hypothetical protein
MLAASSPRAVGEFLNIYGKGLVQSKAISPATYKTKAFEAGKAWESANDEKKKEFILSNLAKLNPVSSAEAAPALSYGKNRAAQIEAATGESARGRQPIQEAAPASFEETHAAEIEAEAQKIRQQNAIKQSAPAKKVSKTYRPKKVQEIIRRSVDKEGNIDERLVWYDPVTKHDYDYDPTIGEESL